MVHAASSPAVVLSDIAHVRPVIGLEVHVELATRTKLFTRVANPACTTELGGEGLPANTLIDPVVLALPGALPVMNKAAVELSMLVGLALGCRIARLTKWDRKSYFYPDLPKAYQISQYDLPLCFDGCVQLPAVDAKGFADFEGPRTPIGIIRAHLEEDAGKLLHEAPGTSSAGSGPLTFSIADYNRAGTPLLEIVTQPDFSSADQCVLFAKLLRTLCRFVGATEGVMQKGHMRFEPNINCVLTLRNGTTATTPIVEVKNLNSFRALKAAIDFELAQQPQRWVEDRRVFGPGTKVTRGWDDARHITFVQRDKEDAHDYRYFPDPDLPHVHVDDAWLASVQARLPELPLARLERYVGEYGLAPKEAFSLVEERDVCMLYEQAIDALVQLNVARSRAGKVMANLLLQQCFKRANERGVEVVQLGLSAGTLGAVGALRESGELSNQSLETLLDLLLSQPTLHAGQHASTPTHVAVDQVRSVARTHNLLTVRDDAQTAAWIAKVLGEHPKVADDVRSGKLQAVGRLVGEVMKLAGGKADASSVRTQILRALGQPG